MFEKVISLRNEFSLFGLVCLNYDFRTIKHRQRPLLVAQGSASNKYKNPFSTIMLFRGFLPEMKKKDFYA